MPSQNVSNTAESGQILLPLVEACPKLAKLGVKISYRVAWVLITEGDLPAVRRGSRIFLIGPIEDLARVVEHALTQRKKAKKAA